MESRPRSNQPRTSASTPPRCSPTGSASTPKRSPACARTASSKAGQPQSSPHPPALPRGPLPPPQAREGLAPRTALTPSLACGGGLGWGLLAYPRRFLDATHEHAAVATGTVLARPAFIGVRLHKTRVACETEGAF